MFSVKKKELFL